jgi:hypothetical protein
MDTVLLHNHGPTYLCECDEEEMNTFVQLEFVINERFDFEI